MKLAGDSNPQLTDRLAATAVLSRSAMWELRRRWAARARPDEGPASRRGGCGPIPPRLRGSWRAPMLGVMHAGGGVGVGALLDLEVEAVPVAVGGGHGHLHV